MNRILCFCVGIFFSITAVFAAEWIKDSEAFEFPGTSVQYHLTSGKGLHLSARQLPGKRMLITYALPVTMSTAVVNIYTINGAKVASLKLDNKSRSVTWNASKKCAGAYTAELKTETTQKSIRFVIAN